LKFKSQQPRENIMTEQLSGEALIRKIISQSMKGIRTSDRTTQEKAEYRVNIEREVRSDYKTLPHEEFTAKYGSGSTTRTPKGKPGPNSKGYRLTPQKQAERDAKRLEERRVQIAAMLKINPPGVSFFSMTNKEENSWWRLDKLPTLEEVEAKKAMIWTAGMMAAYDPRIVLKQMHFGGRVIEFEYLYEGSGDEVKSYNPRF
jgi:hypothetical protein